MYVEYGDYDQRWLVPTDRDHAWHFEEMLGDTALTRANRLVKPWRKAADAGLIEGKVLGILNRVFKRHYIGISCGRTELVGYYKMWADTVERETGRSADRALESPFVEWPLYYCVSDG